FGIQQNLPPEENLKRIAQYVSEIYTILSFHQPKNVVARKIDDSTKNTLGIYYSQTYDNSLGVDFFQKQTPPYIWSSSCQFIFPPFFYPHFAKYVRTIMKYIIIREKININFDAIDFNKIIPLKSNSALFSGNVRIEGRNNTSLNFIAVLNLAQSMSQEEMLALLFKKPEDVEFFQPNGLPKYPLSLTVMWTKN
ncbi:MAG: hypothetical protein GX432_06810, partial [Candidatus Atribacteria bacterium]|nr:hypothetical protein [Candidatus Atribacteria bacterium]